MKHSFDIRKEIPLVSVMVTAYNHRPYIEECLEGVLMQQTNFAFEVFVHDDASTDGTAGIVRAYADKYPQIIIPILQKENQYSQGVDHWEVMQLMARGKYMAICEGDDYWTDPDKLQMQADILEAHPEYSLCFHNAKVAYEGSKRDSRPFALYDKEVYTVEDVIGKWFAPTQSVFFRRSIKDEYPLWTKKVLNADYALLLIAATKGLLFCINKEMSVYRRHGTSLNSTTPFHVMALKTVQVVDYFDMHTNFKYHELIQARIRRLTKDLYKIYLYQRPLWAKLLSVDYYRFRTEAVRLLATETYKQCGWRCVPEIWREIISRLR